MNQLKNSTAIKCLLGFILLPLCLVVNAESLTGKLTQATGSVLVKQADGKVKVIDQNADIAQGDTLVTDGKTYARIQFTDASEIALAPKSTFIVERFSYDKNTPAQNHAEFNLIRGGVQFTAGDIAKNSKDGFVLKTSLGEIKGAASFIIEYTQTGESALAQNTSAYPTLAFNDVAVETQSDALPDYGVSNRLLALTAPVPGAKAPGLYVQVLDGIINLSNGGGSQSFSAGQFGYTASFVKPPIVLPVNPGIQFTPPPAFSSSVAPTNNSSGNKSGAIDCEVR
jgi:hypothetical protein